MSPLNSLLFFVTMAASSPLSTMGRSLQEEADAPAAPFGLSAGLVGVGGAVAEDNDAASQEDEKSSSPIVVIAITLVVLILMCCCCCFCAAGFVVYRRKQQKYKYRKEKEQPSEFQKFQVAMGVPTTQTNESLYTGEFSGRDFD